MNIELLIGIASIIGAVISAIAAIAAIKRDNIKANIEQKTLADKEADRKRKLQSSVANETVGLYRRLSEQYEVMSAKDRKLLRTITFVIRHLIVLDRSVTDLLNEIQIRWDTHEQDADSMECPFYDAITQYMYARVTGVEVIIRETMKEIDTLLLNGNERVIDTDQSPEKEL